MIRIFAQNKTFYQVYTIKENDYVPKTIHNTELKQTNVRFYAKHSFAKKKKPIQNFESYNEIAQPFKGILQASS